MIFLNVYIQTSLLSKSFVALLASIRSLFGMHHQVHLQKLPRRKGVSAVFAHKRSFAGVRSKMHLQAMLGGVLVKTNVARKSPGISVSAQMSFVQGNVMEIFIALNASILKFGFRMAGL